MPKLLVLKTPGDASIDNWQDWTQPKKAEHWKKGRSAMELARAWFVSGSPQTPPEIEQLLASNPLTQKTLFRMGVPEFVTALPERGEGRNHDLMLIGEQNGQPLTTCVEAKADEPFGNLIGDYYKEAKQRQPTTNTRAPERIEKLLNLVFGADADPLKEPWKGLRYQLLTALAGTILQSEQNKCARGLFIVHEFHTSETDSIKISNNEQDYQRFVEALFKPVAPVVNGVFYGPKTFHTSSGSAVEIMMGKAIGNGAENAWQTAVRLYGPSDLRVERVAFEGALAPDEVLIRVLATGVCGSDLHPYETGSIGSTQLNAPLVLGHEFSGVVEEIGGAVQNVQVGTRVAVDPAWVCGTCRECLEGNPNLCRRQRFCGLAPDDGSLRERLVAPARACHPVPDSVSDASAALLEPLGIALHATDLARIRVGSRVAILGAGPIGLCLAQTARLAGAGTVWIDDPLAYRREFAARFGAVPLPEGAEADVVIEAAWARESVQKAMDIVRPGGTVVLVGIPFEDTVQFKHSVARRKGLTILMSRRMKNVYARGLQLVESGRVQLEPLVTHRFPLEKTPQAFELNAKYQDEVVKIIIENTK